MRVESLIFLFLGASLAQANPYFDETKVPRETDYFQKSEIEKSESEYPGKKIQNLEATPALRMNLEWREDETYTLQTAVVENSGTESLQLRSKKRSPWGSYHGILKDLETGESLAFDSIGTGKQYRKLARAITFRFPIPEKSVLFQMEAEHPVTGEMELVFSQVIDPQTILRATPEDLSFEVRRLKEADQSPSIRVVIYAEGYLESRKEQFWKDASKTLHSLVSTRFPGVDRMTFDAVFAPSNEVLGEASDLGTPVPVRDSFLGLYYPYWNGFGRWYHVTYPTSEEKFRKRLAVVPYDYNVILVDSDAYWGVGNYMTHVAIPNQNRSFTYLLLHEFGHFFGLNEEYEGGGRTELEFAAEIQNPWSQNMTFLQSTQLEDLKWEKHVKDRSTPLPTPELFWKEGRYGAYRGGYADSPVAHGHNHKPGMECVMDRYAGFCAICDEGIKDVISHGFGQK